LLCFKGVHLDRQLLGALNIRKVEKSPATNLGTVGKIGILGQGVVLPSARVIYRRAPPDTRSAIEIEKCPASRSRALLDGKMAVLHYRLDFRQDRIIPVQISPARLDHRYFRILEVREGATQKIRLRHKIGIEVRNEFSGGEFQAFR